jgi:gluconate kinase
LNEIKDWAENPDKSPVFWLNGLAGTGKSTIAQTIAERVFAEGQLGASFFCSRDVEDRSSLQLQSNPDVVYESLQDQMQKFLI